MTRESDPTQRHRKWLAAIFLLPAAGIIVSPVAADPNPSPAPPDPGRPESQETTVVTQINVDSSALQYVEISCPGDFRVLVDRDYTPGLPKGFEETDNGVEVKVDREYRWEWAPQGGKIAARNLNPFPRFATVTLHCSR
jgi:hypothetical protein